MKTIIWNEQYLIGIDHFDMQYKKMFDLVHLFLETTFVGKRIYAVSVATFLKDRLTGHIQNTDRTYGQYLLSQTHCQV